MYRIIVLFLTVVTCAFGLEEDECTITHTNERGTCKFLAQCEHVKNARKKNEPYTRCSFKGRREIVCCRNPHQSPPERISVRKCREYAANITLGNQIIEIKDLNCPHTVIPLVVGRADAKENEFPHMALLGFEYKGSIHWDCGGSLISEEYVMTAAHCTCGRTLGNVTRVRLGELDISTPTETDQTTDFNVAQIICHPDYISPSLYNDIALIRLDRQVTISQYIRPACLPTGFEGRPYAAIASGWGATEWFGPRPDILQKVILELFTPDECRNAYPPDNYNRGLRDGIREVEQLCAGSRFGQVDTCQGDSGGPLQVYNQAIDCTYTIIGITSFGAGCGFASFPGVYTRVFNYLDWIESVVWAKYT